MSMDNLSTDCGIAVTASYCLLQLSGPLLYVSPMICVRNTHTTNYNPFPITEDRLCGLVVRVSGYRYRGPRFDPRRYQIF